MERIALLYDDDAYREKLDIAPVAAAAAGTAQGLMGRQVAGQGFLDALLAHGRFDELIGVVRSAASGASLERTCREHPALRSRASRLRLRIVDDRRLMEDFVPAPPAPVLHLPGPIDGRYAWLRRQGGPHGFALCGVTHTLCSIAAVQQLDAMLTAPFEPYDALVCTSSAVVGMVRAVTDAYAGFLRERHGGNPRVPARLVRIPLGVDPERYRPARPEERAAARKRLGIADDTVAVLFVGRLSHHAKAHPFPLFDACSRAAAATGRRVALVLAGWTSNPAIRQAFVDGARAFASGVTTMLVDGTHPELRRQVWEAADVFASPSDNIQETFGLAPIEAMACGLPVVASDWDGYRDLVVDGETGLLVPTLMVPGATAEATARLVSGAVNYDHFLAECSQAVAVEPAAMSRAIERLAADASLRRRMGEAGRRRVLEQFTWERVVRAYESLWASQDEERRERAASEPPPPGRFEIYPAPEVSFAGYPTRWLGSEDRVRAAADAMERVELLLAHPLTNHAPASRIVEASVIREALAAAPGPVAPAVLVDRMAADGAVPAVARATLAWMLKYGLLVREGA